MTSIEGVSDIETDIAGQKCSFKTTNAEIETLLAEKAEGNVHLKDYTTIQ